MLFGTVLGVAFVSALVPVVNVEVYLGVAAAHLDAADQPGRTLVLAVLAGVGQCAGKLVWYLLAARSVESRWVQRKLARRAWRVRYDRWHARVAHRPWVCAGVLLVSAGVGLPPLLIMSVVAGSLRVPLAVFVPTVLVGRTARFWCILAGVGLLAG